MYNPKLSAYEIDKKTAATARILSCGDTKVKPPLRKAADFAEHKKSKVLLQIGSLCDTSI